VIDGLGLTAVEEFFGRAGARSCLRSERVGCYEADWRTLSSTGFDDAAGFVAVDTASQVRVSWSA
jgi:predicted DNA-binding ArsR family transcriptional regulator